MSLVLIENETCVKGYFKCLMFTQMVINAVHSVFIILSEWTFCQFMLNFKYFTRITLHDIVYILISHDSHDQAL